MKVLIAHVPYQHRGGEDVHVDILAKAYQDIGMEVAFLPSSRAASPASLQASARSLLPGHTFPEVQAAWETSRASFIHLHNAFPDLGPRFFRWAIVNRIPMVMTVHNHRFYCTNGIALRDGRICKDCLTSRLPWRPVIRNCNGEGKKSLYHALALAQMHSGHLYSRAIRKFIAPSPYIAEELARFGIPAENIEQIFNPVLVQAESESSPIPDTSDVFYAGRLSEEKGIRGLVETARLLPELRFTVAGSGPESQYVQEATRALPHLTYLGAVPHSRILELIRGTRICILPSICNEILPTFVLESFFVGRRCVVPDLESTRWLAAGIYPGHLADTAKPQSITDAIRQALNAPSPSEPDLSRIRMELGFKSFCDRLRTATEHIRGALKN